MIEPAPETGTTDEDDNRQGGVETTGDTDRVTDTGPVRRGAGRTPSGDTRSGDDSAGTVVSSSESSEGSE